MVPQLRRYCPSQFFTSWEIMVVPGPILVATMHKRWVFDTLTFKVPQFHTKHKYLTRFVKVHSTDSGAKRRGKYRSYGHAVYDEKAVESCLQRLRAFIRPTHGEIMITKCDNHPAYKSKQMDDYRLDSGIHGQFSPPYVHTGVNEVENTWQWDTSIVVQ